MLSTNKLIMEWLCMLPAEESSTQKQRVMNYLTALFTLTFNTSCAAANATYFWMNLNNMNQSLFSLFGVLGCCDIVYVEIMAFILRYKMASIYQQLTDIYKLGKCLAF